MGDLLGEDDALASKNILYRCLDFLSADRPACRGDAVRQLQEYLHRSSGHLTDWYDGETTNTAFVEPRSSGSSRSSRSQLKRCEADNPIRRHARWGGHRES